jgi:hypothetical protein
VLVAAALAPLLLAALVLVLRRRRHPAEPVRVLAEAVPPPATISGDVDPIGALDALLAELESATVRIDGADVLDESAVVELERLADKLHAAAAGLVKPLERVA